jgi:hypothetical protein
MAWRERTQHGPAPRRLTLGSIPGMDERASAEERLAALHAALLAFYDAHTSAFARQRPELSRRERLMSQGLQRLHLQWLPVLGALMVGAVRSMRRGREVSGQLWPVVRTYGELAGKDRHVAQAEVLRMTAQLRPLDSRLPMSGELPRPISRAELEVAADALLRFYVAGRHTDDPLLEATQAAYGEVEAIAEAMLDRAHGQDRSTSAQRREDREQQASANRRYVEAWLRWLDHQPG